MNKKILIASLFATLMLTVPMTSVIGVSDVNEDCGCQVVNNSDLVKVKLLINRLKVITNMLLLRFGHIPEIREKCQELLDIINSDSLWDFPIICAILEPIFIQLIFICAKYYDMLWEYEDDPILRIIINAILVQLAFAIGFFIVLGDIFNCEWMDLYPPPL